MHVQIQTRENLTEKKKQQKIKQNKKNKLNKKKNDVDFSPVTRKSYL